MLILASLINSGKQLQTEWHCGSVCTFNGLCIFWLSATAENKNKLQTACRWEFVRLCIHIEIGRQAVIFSPHSCFYLIMSGHWYWRLLLPQSVNNDLAAVAVRRCQAFDEHSGRSQVALWLLPFYWHPITYTCDFKIYLISHEWTWSGSGIIATHIIISFIL